MRHLASCLAAALLLGGCSYAWIRPDSTPTQARADQQRCRAEATDIVRDVWFDPAAFGWGQMIRPWGAGWYGGPGWYGGWWPNPSAELAAQQELQDRCMRTKGYDSVRVDRKTGAPR